MSDFLEDLDKLGHHDKSKQEEAPEPTPLPQVALPEEASIEVQEAVMEPVENVESQPEIQESKQGLSQSEPPKKAKRPKSDDGGYWSRKFTLSVGMALLVTKLAIVSAIWPQFAGVFGELTNTLMGILAIYIGGNTATKWVSSRKK